MLYFDVIQMQSQCEKQQGAIHLIRRGCSQIRERLRHLVGRCDVRHTRQLLPPILGQPIGRRHTNLRENGVTYRWGYRIPS